MKKHLKIWAIVLFGMFALSVHSCMVPNDGAEIILSDSSLEFDSGGGVRFVVVTGKEWNVEEGHDWLKVDQFINGIVVIVEATDEAREGLITVSNSQGSAVIAVKQAAPVEQPVYDVVVDVESVSFDATGIATTPSEVTVTGADWSVAVTEGDDWITIVPALNGSAGDSFTVEVLANNRGVRRGEITVSNTLGTSFKTIVVEQAASPNLVDFGTLVGGEFSKIDIGDVYALDGRLYGDNCEILISMLFYEATGDIENIPDGVYRIDESAFEPGTISQGVIDPFVESGTRIVLYEDSVEVERLPIRAGTVTVSHSGDTYTLEFDVVDRTPQEAGTPRVIIGKYVGKSTNLNSL